MTKTPATDMPLIIPDTGVERIKLGTYMNYPEKKNIDEAICQKLGKKYVYETDMHRI